MTERESLFIKQETVANRGKSTCFATSIVNAAIALGAVNLKDARAQHPNIIAHLIAIPDLWNGATQRIQTFDTRIAEIVEMYLPIRVGLDSNAGRLMIVYKTFNKIWEDLVTREAAFVLTVPEAIHAYALTTARVEDGEKAIAYIDPFKPHETRISSQGWFKKAFYPDSNGCVPTTPVRKRV